MVWRSLCRHSVALHQPVCRTLLLRAWRSRQRQQSLPAPPAPRPLLASCCLVQARITWALWLPAGPLSLLSSGVTLCYSLFHAPFHLHATVLHCPKVPWPLAACCASPSLALPSRRHPICSQACAPCLLCQTSLFCLFVGRTRLCLSLPTVWCVVAMSPAIHPSLVRYTHRLLWQAAAI